MRNKRFTQISALAARAGSTLGWIMTGLLAILAGHTMGFSGEEGIGIPAPMLTAGLISQAIILCPATPLPWAIRCGGALVLALIL